MIINDGKVAKQFHLCYITIMFPLRARVIYDPHLHTTFINKMKVQRRKKKTKKKKILDLC